MSPMRVKVLMGEEGGPDMGSGSFVGVCLALFGLCLLCALDKSPPLSEPHSSSVKGNGRCHTSEAE